MVMSQLLHPSSEAPRSTLRYVVLNYEPVPLSIPILLLVPQPRVPQVFMVSILRKTLDYGKSRREMGGRGMERE